ncbi:hypothetical protein OG535_22455 [Kitasatospora sp. NBC_00085]|uniref:effector-associated constant component EACC1 n=1 Tax=unclassified Kitasatospora TaxID=2633591 RepID=UPI003253EEC3
MSISVRSGAGEDASGGLLRWLDRQPELRGVVRRDDTAVPPPGTMGGAGELFLAVLAPGGVAAVLATAVVAWVQNRRGGQSVSVTVTRPDGGQVTVASDRVRPMNPEQLAELTRRIADVIEPGPPSAEPPSAEPPLSAGPPTAVPPSGPPPAPRGLPPVRG